MDHLYYYLLKITFLFKNHETSLSMPKQRWLILRNWEFGPSLSSVFHSFVSFYKRIAFVVVNWFPCKRALKNIYFTSDTPVAS